MKEHETDWERLKHEVLASIREGVAMADIGIEELALRGNVWVNSAG